MSVQTLYDTGSSYQVTSKFDGGVYAVATSDCVIGGIGDQFTLSNYSPSSLDVQFISGSQAVIGGGFFKVTNTETITLTPSSTIYLCATIDLTKANGARGRFEQRTQASMRSDNLNGSGTVRDMLLYIITTDASGVTNVVDKRKIVTSGGGMNAKKYTNINVSGTPQALSSYCAWDTQELYGFYLDVTINGLTTNTMIENIIMTDTLLASIGYIVTTNTNSLRLYTSDNTVISGTIITLVTSEV